MFADLKYWYFDAIQNYAVFQGRARRTAFWMFALANAVISIGLLLLSRAVPLFSSITVLYDLAVLVPALALGARRLHDTGRSGWWLVASLVPLIGTLLLIWFFVQDSEHGENAYGPNPKTASGQTALPRPAA